MLMNLLQDNFAWMLPSCTVDDATSNPAKHAGYIQPDNWMKELGLNRDDNQSCSATSVSSQESSVFSWHSPVALQEDRPAQRRLIKQASKPSINEDLDLPVFPKKRSRKLPGTWYYSSNHIMINTERSKNNRHPLVRKNYLDEAARWHAANMAKEGRLFHAKADDLKEKVGRPSRILGVNVFRGDSIRAIHNKMMQSPADVSNMLDERYIDFGMGTANSAEGDLLLVQIYMG